MVGGSPGGTPACPSLYLLCWAGSDRHACSAILLPIPICHTALGAREAALPHPNSPFVLHCCVCHPHQLCGGGRVLLPHPLLEAPNYPTGHWFLVDLPRLPHHPRPTFLPSIPNSAHCVAGCIVFCVVFVSVSSVPHTGTCQGPFWEDVLPALGYPTSAASSILTRPQQTGRLPCRLTWALLPTLQL